MGFSWEIYSVRRTPVRDTAVVNESNRNFFINYYDFRLFNNHLYANCDTSFFFASYFFFTFFPKKMQVIMNFYNPLSIGKEWKFFAIFSMNGHESTDLTFPVLRRYGGLRGEKPLFAYDALFCLIRLQKYWERGVTINTHANWRRHIGFKSWDITNRSISFDRLTTSYNVIHRLL